MTIDVLLFAKARDLFGVSDIAVSLPKTATAGDVWIELCRACGAGNSVAVRTIGGESTVCDE